MADSHNDKVDAEIRKMREEARRRHDQRSGRAPSGSSEQKSSPPQHDLDEPDFAASSPPSASSRSDFRSALRGALVGTSSSSSSGASPEGALASRDGGIGIEPSPDYGARFKQMQSDAEFARRLQEKDVMEFRAIRQSQEEHQREENDRELEEAQLRAAIYASVSAEAVASERSRLSVSAEGDRERDSARQRLAFDSSGYDEDLDVVMSPAAQLDLGRSNSSSELERRQSRGREAGRRANLPIDLTADSPSSMSRSRSFDRRSPSPGSSSALIRQRQRERQREVLLRERERERLLGRDRERQRQAEENTDHDEEYARRIQRELWADGRTAARDADRDASIFDSPLSIGDRRLHAFPDSASRRRIAFQRGGLSFSMDFGDEPRVRRFSGPSYESYFRQRTPERPGHLDLMQLMSGHAISSPVSPHPRVLVRGFPGGGSMDLDNMGYEELLALSERIGHVNRGADETTISHLPTRTISKGDIAKAENKDNDGDSNSKSCAICMEEFAEGDEVRSLPCFHMFHKDEIDKWLQMNKECPVCKHKIDDAGSIPQS